MSVRQATSGIFDTLQKTPILGRAFTADEDKPGAPRVVLLGEGFWERRFARDPSIVGRTLTLSGESVNVIGSSQRPLWLRPIRPRHETRASTPDFTRLAGRATLGGKGRACR